jgi:hypothetical protein
MVSLTTLAIVMAATSTATQVYGAVKQGQAAKKAGQAGQAAADDQASLSDYNAGVAELQATDAIARGTDEENRYRTQVRGIVGQQRAEFAGANIDVGYGSAVDVQADAAMLGELDALQIKTNAAREAWGYKVQAEDYRRQGQIQRKTGQQLAAAGNANASAAYIGAAGTALGGASSLLLTKYGMKKASA